MMMKKRNDQRKSRKPVVGWLASLFFFFVNFSSPSFFVVSDSEKTESKKEKPKIKEPKKDKPKPKKTEDNGDSSEKKTKNITSTVTFFSFSGLVNSSSFARSILYQDSSNPKASKEIAPPSFSSGSGRKKSADKPNVAKKRSSDESRKSSKSSSEDVPSWDSVRELVKSKPVKPEDVVAGYDLTPPVERPALIGLFCCLIFARVLIFFLFVSDSNEKVDS
jgi:hypothetical protein